MRPMRRAMPALAALFLAMPMAVAQQPGGPSAPPSGARQDSSGTQDAPPGQEGRQPAGHAPLREQENQQWQREREQLIRDGHGVPHNKQGEAMDTGTPRR